MCMLEKMFIVQGFVNLKRYYGMFESTRIAAESYFQKTNRNYFNDFMLIHNALGLTYTHKSAVMVFPLVSAFNFVWYFYH